MDWGRRESVPWFASIYPVEELGKRVGECKSGSSHSLGVAYFFNAMITNISQIRNGEGHIKKENVLISWYVWFRGEFFFQ